jgi:nitrite reductase/ring-hydroxylating ferredoxin subunit
VSGAVLCGLEEIAEPGARAFRVGTGDWPLSGFLVRHAGRLCAYVNRCPHAGHPLNLLPDRFLTADGSLIVCSSHGALFAPATGECVAGPCLGSHLTPLKVAVVDGHVHYLGALPEGVDGSG